MSAAGSLSMRSSVSMPISIARDVVSHGNRGSRLKATVSLAFSCHTKATSAIEIPRALLLRAQHVEYVGCGRIPDRVADHLNRQTGLDRDRHVDRGGKGAEHVC